MAIQKIVTDDALSAFASDVKAAIANVSSPLVYKGTLGTGGTISTLPAASASNNGFAYVVITAGTYQGVVCAVGDVIASNGTAWNIIPQANSAETLPITTGSAVNTKEYIDDKTTLIKSASGSLVHITDGADNIPVKSLVSQIVAVESGSGEKSPANPYTISGFDSGIVTRCGVNLWDEKWEIGSISDSDGSNAVDNLKIRSKNYTPIKPSTDYFIVCPSTSKNGKAFFYDKNKTLISNAWFYGNVITTSPSNAYYIRFRMVNAYGTTYNNDISINYPSSDTQYHSYNGNTYTFAFGQTVYGGHFDNKGNLVVTHSIVDLGGLTWVANSTSTSGKYRMKALVAGLKPTSTAVAIPNLCCSSYITVSGVDTHNLIKGITASHTEGALFVYDSNYDTSESASAFKTAMSGVMLVYELATPITLSITSQDIPTLLGENNIYSNCGDVEVTYYTYKSNDILEFIDSEIGKKNGTNIPIEGNSQDSIKDYIDTGLSGKADTSDTYTKSEIDNFLNGNVKLAYWSSQATSNYSIPLANLRSASGRDYGMAIVFAWKEIFAFHYDSNANLPVYNLTQGGNRTMTAAYNSSTQSIDLTFSGGNVWYGIGVLAI